ncbi:hypothetical protein CRM90_25040 [Mycobacterium sp. ENV421]|uniref:hypothetical protein n=1 Tax=Mycobacterium sp. ENV421 TaxID=1213407 RepID=UPI000C9B4EC5|nr:hypothetical protein [Mycobacterium sp. ENV421]PND55013.1 hypothetical protein CRM90_25040 [Mycobacterium sp. ENV421]
MIALAAQVMLPTTSIAHADACPDVHVVYARGTDTVPPVDAVGQALVNTRYVSSGVVTQAAQFAVSRLTSAG